MALKPRRYVRFTLRWLWIPALLLAIFVGRWRGNNGSSYFRPVTHAVSISAGGHAAIHGVEFRLDKILIWTPQSIDDNPDGVWVQLTLTITNHTKRVFNDDAGRGSDFVLGSDVQSADNVRYHEESHGIVAPYGSAQALPDLMMTKVQPGETKQVVEGYDIAPGELPNARLRLIASSQRDTAYFFDLGI